MKSDTEILDTALHVFQQDGYVGATMHHIAEQAGINEVTLFRKFKTKENLFRLSVQRIGQDTLNTLEDIFAGDSSLPLESQLLTLFDRLQGYLGHAIPIILRLLGESSRGFPEVKESLLQVPRMLYSRIKIIFEARAAQVGKLADDSVLLSYAFLSFTFYHALMNDLSEGNLMDGRIQNLPTEYIRLILRNSNQSIHDSEIQK
jgi:AcrR family transcriptional regulator